MRTIIFKLSGKLYADLQSAARERGIDKAQLVREAIQNRVGRKWRKTSQCAFDLVKDLSGKIKGPQGLLSRSGRIDK